MNCNFVCVEVEKRRLTTRAWLVRRRGVDGPMVSGKSRNGNHTAFSI